jgi:glucose-6-phosphate isomerase, archaeal
MEFDLTKLTPDVRKLDDMREVLYDKGFAKNSPDLELYYMYRNLKQENGLKYNITVTPSKMLGSEFVKTTGHVHNGPQKEIYHVLEGEAIFLMQKGDGEKIEDVYAVKAKAGEAAVIPSFYGHATINPSYKDLKTEDWSPVETESDYSMYKKLHGACYFYTVNGWIKNENYKNVPELRFEKPLKSIPEDLSFLK